jgi:hypothetical protein
MSCFWHLYVSLEAAFKRFNWLSISINLFIQEFGVKIEDVLFVQILNLVVAVMTIVRRRVVEGLELDEKDLLE